MMIFTMSDDHLKLATEKVCNSERESTLLSESPSV